MSLSCSSAGTLVAELLANVSCPVSSTMTFEGSREKEKEKLSTPLPIPHFF